MSTSRRRFLTRSAQLGALAVGDFAFLNHLPAADDARRPMAELAADVEPLVRLVEDTPRERLLEAVAERIRAGTSYQQWLAAVMLAGVRGIQPRPVGFKFHAVLVINSAHLASLAADDRDRWLPLFWALDNFKASQARNRREGDWVMPPMTEQRLPAPADAARQFRAAMEAWQVEPADRAVAACARTLSGNELYEMFWRLGCRDFRDIGHKAIYVANSYRTLQTIGWRLAEPIVRSLAYALLAHEGTSPAERDDERDRPYRDNLRRLTRIRTGWQRGRVVPETTTELLALLRTAGPAEACEAVVTKLNERVDPACVWDALFLTAGELLMRQPGIVGLHTVTTTNALHYGYTTTASDETRRLLLLQAAAFLPLFREAMRGRGQLPDTPRIDTLEPAEAVPEVGDIFATLGQDRHRAARQTLALLQADRGHSLPLMAAARRLVFAKGTDSHDYKFSSAALEDFYGVSPAWRDRYLASSVYWLKGADAADTPLLRRTRAALGT